MTQKIPTSRTDRDPQLVIGLSGYVGSGKDTVGQMLETMWGWTLAFSDPMYAILAEVLNVPVSHLYETKRKSAEIRRQLQAIGQSSRDHIHPDVWVMSAHRRAKEVPPGRFPVITDVRYPNEIKLIRQMGGELWWIDRPGHAPINHHESEKHYESIREAADRTIHNDGDLDALFRKVRDARL